MATKKTKIAEIKVVTQGVTRGKAWQLNNIVDTDNVRYGVFGTMLNESGVKVGDEVLINFQEEAWEKNGKKGVNKKVTDITRLISHDTGLTPPVAPNKPLSEAPASQKNEGLETLKRIEKKVDEVLARIP